MSQDQSPAIVETPLAAPQLPDMGNFTARIREVQRTIGEKMEALQQLLVRKRDDINYHLVEIGWILLQGKAAISHGLSGKQSNNGEKVKSETIQIVSDLTSGFEQWVVKEFKEINIRSARNYMNAARNLGLSAESTLDDVRALRAEKALEGKRMADLYRPPHGGWPEDQAAPFELMSTELMIEQATNDTREWFIGWAQATRNNLVESVNWINLNAQEREALCELTGEAHRLLKESLQKDREQFKNPRSLAATKKEPVVKTLPELGTIPQWQKRTKGERWWWGYDTGTGTPSTVIQIIKGANIAPFSRFKEAHPEILVVGPFKASSVRYARVKVIELTKKANANEEASEWNFPAPLTDAQRQRVQTALGRLESAHAAFEAKLKAFAEATATRTTLDRQIDGARARLVVSAAEVDALKTQHGAFENLCQTRKGEMEAARALAVDAIGQAGKAVREIAGPLEDQFRRGLVSALQPFCTDPAGAVAALPTHRTELPALQTFLCRGLHVSRTATAEEIEFLRFELGGTLQAILDGGEIWRLRGEPAARPAQMA